MNLFVSVFQIIAASIAIAAALASILFFVRLRWPAPALWFLKLYVSALSPWLAVAGLVIAFTGFASGFLLTALVGSYDLIVFSLHAFRVSRPPRPETGFEKAFGPDWQSRITTEQESPMLSSRIALTLPAVLAPRLEQNVAFATISGNGRQLLCDVWQPHQSIVPSGLAFVYLHGSAFYLLDKDLGTRPFFQQLTALGHVVMDVAYRLSPETDMMGMIADVKRAVAWMKENAHSYGVDPHRIVIGGGSAGGHLALLAAYTANNRDFLPRDLEGKDTEVCGVISLYGSSDMTDIYYHVNQHLTTRDVPGRKRKAVPTKMPRWMVKAMGEEYHRLGFDKGFVNAGALAPLLGGHPDECPETYARFSVITHVHPGCPPTLLIHGTHDIMAPVTSTRKLYRRLVEDNVRTALHLLPQTDHAFDLILPRISPSAHNALYDVERFLALLGQIARKPEPIPTRTVEPQPLAH